MPHQEEFKTIQIRQLHPTFAAEVIGVDFTHPLSDDVFQDIKSAIAKYGVLVFRSTTLDDAGHVTFAGMFGDLDDASPYIKPGRTHRFGRHIHLFDVGNIDESGAVRPLDTILGAAAKGNGLFHVDSSFNPRRAGLSLLRGVKLPPRGTGGNTEYADTRSAWEELDGETKRVLEKEDYVVAHSLMHSRKTAAPDVFDDIDPEDHPMALHKLVQRHEASGRMNLYIASHAHHIVGLPKSQSDALLSRLYKHACQPTYVVSVEWENEGDLIMWDNTCVMHRAAGGSYMGKYARDMRRATVHDGSTSAWGMNKVGGARQAY